MSLARMDGGLAARDVVIGVGNAWCHDDGLGPVVAERCARMGLDADVVVLDGEASRIVDAWSGRRRAVVIDAARGLMGTAGRIRRIGSGDDELPGGRSSGSSHGLGVAEAVELGAALGAMPDRLVVLAVDGVDFSAGVGLTPAVDAVVDDVVALVCRELLPPAEESGDVPR